MVTIGALWLRHPALLALRCGWRVPSSGWSCHTISRTTRSSPMRMQSVSALTASGGRSRPVQHPLRGLGEGSLRTRRPLVGSRRVRWASSPSCRRVHRRWGARSYCRSSSIFSISTVVAYMASRTLDPGARLPRRVQGLLAQWRGSRTALPRCRMRSGLGDRGPESSKGCWTHSRTGSLPLDSSAGFGRHEAHMTSNGGVSGGRIRIAVLCGSVRPGNYTRMAVDVVVASLSARSGHCGSI